MDDALKDELKTQAQSAPDQASARRKKGGNIVATAAETSKIIAADGKTDAAIAANIYNKAFAAGYVSERQRGAEELQGLIQSAGEATRAAIASVDAEQAIAELPAGFEEDTKKSLAGIFDQYF